MTDSPATGNIDTSRPHSARMYDYYLGGLRSHFDVDRAAADRVAQAWRGVFVCVRHNRAFMHRATRVLAREYGIRQWLDIGTGIPTEPNLHQVAQAVVPEARVVYADHDPLVLTHAESLMRGAPEGRTTFVLADVREPDALLAAPELTAVLDLSRPVALSLNALLHFVPDDQDAYGIVRRLMRALPSGSALALSHGTPDFDPATLEQVEQIYAAGGTPVQFRTQQAVARFFDGLDLLEPGVVGCHRWRPEPAYPAPDTAAPGSAPARGPADAEISLWSGVAIKP